jgi:hypothetical protein
VQHRDLLLERHRPGWRAHPSSHPSALPERKELAQLTRYARLLDTAFRIPGTNVRIGLDPIIGLIPGVGDWIGVGLSTWIVVRAAQLGVRRRTLARMLGNLALEATLGAVPLAGDLFDAWFRANRRNVRLLERELARRRTE